ncbi:MAG: hypothetical protein Q8P05_00540 [Candidatus Diapherotrites archaeon]|nr:hypothetical protein [Candidatus Diapherotrites archaeon]
MPEKKRSISSIWDFIELLRWQKLIDRNGPVTRMLTIAPFFYKRFNFPYEQIYAIERERLKELNKIPLNVTTTEQHNDAIAKTMTSLRKFGFQPPGKFITKSGKRILFPFKKIIGRGVMQLDSAHLPKLQPERVYLPSGFDTRYEKPNRAGLARRKRSRPK